jgi:hypothetical protein
MTEHSHSHSHGISHEEIDLLKKSQFYKEIEKQNANLEISEVEESLELAWSEYVATKKKVVFYSTQSALSLIQKFVPNAKYLVVYEDHSHDAPHGHIEVILDETMHEISLDGDWHDLEWSHEVDELIWDIYSLAKEYFSLVGGKRRLLLGA